MSTATHDPEWHSFLTAKSARGIVHIINHTVHILWEDVMIFTNKRGLLLDFWGSSSRGELPHIGTGSVGQHGLVPLKIRRSNQEYIVFWSYFPGVGVVSAIDRIRAPVQIITRGKAVLRTREDTFLHTVSAEGDRHGRGCPFRDFVYSISIFVRQA